MDHKRYHVINPLGISSLSVTYDVFYDSARYKAEDEALYAMNFVTVDFVQNEAMSIGLMIQHIKSFSVKRYLQLSCQDLSKGLSEKDERAMMDIVLEILSQS